MRGRLISLAVTAFSSFYPWIQEITKIAKRTRRSLSNATVQLLWRGIEAYRKDGVLVDTRPERSNPNDDPDPESDVIDIDTVQKDRAATNRK